MPAPTYLDRPGIRGAFARRRVRRIRARLAANRPTPEHVASVLAAADALYERQQGHARPRVPRQRAGAHDRP